MEVNVCNLEQDDGYYDPGHGDLEEWCLVEKKEGTTGERTKKENYWSVRCLGSLFAPGACSTPREEVYT